ncbi:MAG: flagellar basal body L-ring protein FlgH [Gemmatimonadota bacterium]
MIRTLRRTIALTLVPAALAAQTPAAQAPAATPPVPAVLTSFTRASWLSDRLPLRVGDLLTVVVDEQTAGSERVHTIAQANRSQRAQIGISVDPANRLGPAKDFSTGLQSNSNDQGDAGRQGNLTAVLSVRVTAIDATGLATIEGNKSVTVDGRLQEVRLKGIIRPEDVTPSNLVASNRIAEAVLSYKGKKIGPRTGILGKILAILWP